MQFFASRHIRENPSNTRSCTDHTWVFKTASGTPVETIGSSRIEITCTVKGIKNGAFHDLAKFTVTLRGTTEISQTSGKCLDSQPNHHKQRSERHKLEVGCLTALCGIEHNAVGGKGGRPKSTSQHLVPEFGGTAAARVHFPTCLRWHFENDAISPCSIFRLIPTFKSWSIVGRWHMQILVLIGHHLVSPDQACLVPDGHRRSERIRHAELTSGINTNKATALSSVSGVDDEPISRQPRMFMDIRLSNIKWKTLVDTGAPCNFPRPDYDVAQVDPKYPNDTWIEHVNNTKQYLTPRNLSAENGIPPKAPAESGIPPSAECAGAIFLVSPAEHKLSVQKVATPHTKQTDHQGSSSHTTSRDSKCDDGAGSFPPRRFRLAEFRLAEFRPQPNFCRPWRKIVDEAESVEKFRAGIRAVLDATRVLGTANMCYQATRGPSFNAKWHETLPLARCCIRSAINSLTGYSPYEVLQQLGSGALRDDNRLTHASTKLKMRTECADAKTNVSTTSVNEASLFQTGDVRASLPPTNTRLANDAVAELRSNQQDGQMIISVQQFTLPGYERDTMCRGTIEITYDIPDSVQTNAHPHPGRPLRGAYRAAYLPNNADGRKVLELLKRAWQAKLIFTVGQSARTSRDDYVMWNCIHHKTSISGGPQSFGYPDPTYIKRVTDELAAVGIVDESTSAVAAVVTTPAERESESTESSMLEERNITLIRSDKLTAVNYPVVEPAIDPSSRTRSQSMPLSCPRNVAGKCAVCSREMDGRELNDVEQLRCGHHLRGYSSRPRHKTCPICSTAVTPTPKDPNDTGVEHVYNMKKYLAPRNGSAESGIPPEAFRRNTISDVSSVTCRIRKFFTSQVRSHR